MSESTNGNAAIEANGKAAYALKNCSANNNNNNLISESNSEMLKTVGKKCN